MNHVGHLKKNILLVLVGSAFLASATPALAILYYDTAGEAAAACASASQAANANYPWDFACTDYPASMYLVCASPSTGNTCGTLYGQFRYTENCPTDEGMQFTSNPPPATVCLDGCRYISGGTGVGVCAGNQCLSPYTGAGQLCTGDEGSGSPDGCTVDGDGVVVCDCLEVPEICV